jgi:hypothetical protein
MKIVIIENNVISEFINILLMFSKFFHCWLSLFKSVIVIKYQLLNNFSELRTEYKKHKSCFFVEKLCHDHVLNIEKWA